MKKITKSEKETYNLAKKFVTKLKGGEVLALIGDLGSGKTAFTKGIAGGLGIKNVITSPTFVLMKNYQGKNLKLAHIDAYRLSSGDELEAIGINDFFSDNKCITVIEWADRVKDILPKNTIVIKFKVLEGDKREIIF